MQETGYKLAGVGMAPIKARDGSIRAWFAVDLDDFAEIAQHRWYLAGKGYVWRPYGCGRKGTKSLYLSRYLMALDFGDRRDVDHYDGNPLNNRRSNLRVSTHAQNAQNRSYGYGSSSYRGVSWDRERGRWIAYGKAGGRLKNLGRYDDELEAARVAATWRREHLPFSHQTEHLLDEAPSVG